MIHYAHSWELRLVPVVELTDEQIARCKELSYGDEGYMCEDLDIIRETEPIKGRPSYRLSTAVLVYEHDGSIVGWSLLQPVPRSPRWTAQLFVDPQHRRRGIGRSLLFQANAYGDNKRRPICYIDDDNEEFFKKNPSLYTEV